MKTISRYIMTLALLLTAVTGAWAQDANYEIDVQFDNQYNPNETHFDCNIHNHQNLEAEIKGTLYLYVDGDFKGSFDVDDEMVHGSIPALDAGDYTWSAVFHPEEGGEFSRNGNFTIDKVNTSISYDGSTSINLGVGESTELDVYMNPDEAGVLSYSSSDASVASITKELSFRYLIEAKAAGTATITFSFADSKNYEAAEDKKITVTVSTPPIDVTINAAEEGGTFTEAWFNMPANDVTAEYELLRDMSVQMTATMGDGTDGLRYRVKKSEQNPGKYEPADMDMMQVLALVAVNDGIEQKALTLNQDYFCRIYKLDEQTLQPEGDGVELVDFDFAPGLYALKAVAKDDSDYDGETALSNTFKLFQGYEVVVPAKEFITYYKDEKLYVEDEDAKLYTITAVNGDKATATELTVAAASTPLLVKNNGATEKTILLIPTTNEADNVTAATEFKGTLDAAQIAASTSTQNNYAFNGKEFVWVKNAIDIAANKAWLEVNTPSNARSVSIVFGDTTGISEALRVKSEESADGDWYDLDGRKLQAAPKRKGVYIHNGRKEVVK